MNQHNKLGSAAFYKTSLAIAIPVMLQGLVQNLVSLIDNFMVAGLGDIKMSGVNITNQIIFVFFVSLMTLTSAGGIFMSQFNGAKNSEGMQQTFRFKLFATFIVALIFTALSVFLPKQLLGILVHNNTQSDVIIKEGSTYLAIIVFTYIPLSISMVIGSSLREIGRVRAPLVISIIATLINTFFNWMLIYGNMGAPRMEVAGAAIATVIARLAEMIIFLVYITITKPPFYFRIVRIFKINIALFITILKKSGIIFVTDMSWVLTETVMTAVYNGRGGAEIVSGMAAGWAIANLFFLVFGGIHTTVGVIVGGTLGRNELDLARDQARWLRSGSLVMGFFISIFEVASVLLIPIVFGNLSLESQLITRNMIWLIAIYMPMWTFLNAQFATARAGGDAIMGVWVDVSVNLFLFLPSIFLLAYFTKLGPIEMYGIVKITDAVKVAIAFWQLRTERWIKNLTYEHSSYGAVS